MKKVYGASFVLRVMIANLWNIGNVRNYDVF